MDFFQCSWLWCFAVCRAIRSAAVPEAAKLQLSTAVQDLLKQLFTTVAQQWVTQSPDWDKSGCYLLLRALTRSQQFIDDPGVPVLPAAAVETLRWVQQHVLGAQSPADTAALKEQALQMPAQDDKPFLLLTRLVLTATGAPAAVAEAAAESDGTGYYSAISAAVSAAAVQTNGQSASSVKWSDAPGVAQSAAGTGSSNVPNGGAGGTSVGVRDPALLVGLLEFSSTKVKLALQRLLEPSGAHLEEPVRMCACSMV
jgi:hypothetical protein